MSSWRRRPAGTAPEAEGKLVPCPRPPPAPRPAGRISSVLVNAPDVYAHTYIRARIKAIRRRKLSVTSPHSSSIPPPPLPRHFEYSWPIEPCFLFPPFFFLYGYNISSWKIANVINLTRDWTIRNDIPYLILSILNFFKFTKRGLRCNIEFIYILLQR